MDRLSHLPFEIKSSIFHRASALDIIRCQRLSQSWRDCLSDPQLLRNVASKYTLPENLIPTEEEAAFDDPKAYYTRALKRAHNFRAGRVTGDHGFKLPPRGGKNSDSDPCPVRRSFLFSAEQLLVIDSREWWSHIKVHELQILRVAGTPPASRDICKQYRYDGEHELTKFKCSKSYLSCIAENMGCFIWRRQAPEQEQPVEIVDIGDCHDIAVSDEAIVVMSSEHATVWDASSGKTTRFPVDILSPSGSNDLVRSKIMIESERRTFFCIRYELFTSWFIFRRYNMHGRLLNHFQAPPNFHVFGHGLAEAEWFKRQPDGTYLVYHEEPATFRNHLTLIYFDPERFQVFQMQSDIDLGGKEISSMLVDQETAWYCGNESSALYAVGSDAQGFWKPRATLQPPKLVNGKQGRLLGNERMLFLVRGRWCWAMWFD